MRQGRGAAQDDGANSAPLSVGEDGITRLFGYETFSGSMTALLERFSAELRTGGAHLVVTPNVDHMINLSKSGSFRSVYEKSSIRILDGMPLVRLARSLGADSPNRLTGADLLLACAAESAARSWTIAVLGTMETAVAAAAQLNADYPGSAVHPVELPMLSRVADPASMKSIERLVELSPDVVFICVGSPKQENWFFEWESTLPTAMYVGAGAAVEFASGAKRRAPMWAQSAGLEWVWRVAQEPKRLLARYLVKGPKFLVLRSRSLRMRRK